MTTSITDARFTSLHFTPGHLLSLDIDEPPETGWSVMPGYDQSLPIPQYLEPPHLDADETLPSQLHPSYPYGRPPTVGRPIRPWMSGPGNLLGTLEGDALGSGSGSGSGRGGDGGDWGGGSGGGRAGRWGRGEGWEELGMRGIMRVEQRKEVPPGMAGAKRPPSPPSPSLHPALVPSPRSSHLRSLLARQQQAPTPTQPVDPFDAPVPNETFVEDAEEAGEEDRGEEQGNGRGGGAPGGGGGQAQTRGQGGGQVPGGRRGRGREGTQNRPEMEEEEDQSLEEEVD